MAKILDNGTSGGVKKKKTESQKVKKIAVQKAAPKIVAPKAPQIKQQVKQLMDQRAVPKTSERSGRTALLILGLGLLAGAGVMVYFLYFYNPVIEEYRPAQIIVPALDEETGAAEPAPAPAELAVTVQWVEISDTPLGYLNVRKGAGTNFEKFAQVKPGEKYELVAETAANGGWLEIRLDAARTGWVSRQYATIK